MSSADRLKKGSTPSNLLSPLYASLLDHVPQGVFLLDSSGCILHANPAGCHLAHYDETELAGSSITALLDFHVASPSTAVHASPLRLGLRTKHGSVIPCDVRCVGRVDGVTQLLVARLECKETDDALRALMVGTATAVGDQFLRSLARHVALVLGYQYALVSEVTAEASSEASVLAMWDTDHFVEPFVYELRGTPCERAVQTGACFYASDVAALFPDDAWLAAAGAQSYLGMPVLNAQGDAIGVLAAIHSEPKDTKDDARALLSIFAARAAAELERKRAETKLRESEARYRQLVQEHPYGILVHSDGTILYANDAAVQLGGAGRLEEVVGRPVLSFMHPDFMAIARERIERMYQEKPTPPLQREKLIRMDGGIVDIEVTAIATRYEGKRAVQTIIRDITADLQSEQAARENESRLRMIYEHSPVMMHSVDENDAICNVNRKWLEETGYAREEVVGRPVLSFFDAACHEHAVHCINPQFWRKGRVPIEPLQMQCKGGAIIDVLVECQPVTEPDGRRIRLAVVRNITEQRRAQEAQLRLTAAIEQAAEAIVITDTTGAIVYVNPAFERISGFSRAEAIGARPSMQKSGKHDRAFYQNMWNTIQSGDTWSGHFVNRNKNGTLYEEEATISPVRDGSGRIVNYVAVKRDITRESALESQLRQAQKMEAVGQLAGGIAHDFNNLLQAMMAHAALGMDSIAPTEPVYADLANIRDTAVRAASLTRQLLAFSRRQVLQSKDLNVNEVVDEILKMLSRVIGEHVELKFTPNPDLWAVHADPHQVEQVLINLCVNARDAMPDGGVISITTDHTTLDEAFQEAHPWARPGDYVVMTVTDTGTGMDEATMARVFEPFFTTKELGHGTGLGLATVYGIVKQHNGLIHIYSEPGHGSTFKIYLPRVAGTGVRAVADAAAATTARGDELILLAEDEELVRNGTRRVLESAGYRVICARNGLEAVEKFEQHAAEIALALLDITMPELSGYEVARRLRALRPDIHVLYCSGYGAAGAGLDKEPKPVELLQKPYAPSDLLRRIRKLLDRPDGA